jgi:hypothetical protein
MLRFGSRIRDLFGPWIWNKTSGIRNTALFREADIGHGVKDGQYDPYERGYDAPVQYTESLLCLLFSPRVHR